MTRSACLKLAAAAAGSVLVACAASGDPGPVSGTGGTGGTADAASGSGGTAGQPEGGSAGESGEGEGGSAGEGGAAGEGGSAGTGGTAGTGGAEDAGPPCDKFWTREICPEVGSTPGASVAFNFLGGALVLTETSAPFLCGSATKPTLPLKLYQSGLSGDFEIVFAFEKFVAASYGAGIHAYVYEINNDQEWAQAALLDNGTGLNVKVTVTHGGVKQEDVGSTSNTSGTFTLRRLGALVTALVDAGGDKKTLSGALTKNDLRVGIAIQGPFNPADPPAPSSASFTSFTVTNGGGKVRSDTFDCNSVF